MMYVSKVGKVCIVDMYDTMIGKNSFSFTLVVVFLSRAFHLRSTIHTYSLASATAFFMAFSRLLTATASSQHTVSLPFFGEDDSIKA